MLLPINYVAPRVTVSRTRRFLAAATAAAGSRGLEAGPRLDGTDLHVARVRLDEGAVEEAHQLREARGLLVVARDAEVAAQLVVVLAVHLRTGRDRTLRPRAARRASGRRPTLSASVAGASLDVGGGGGRGRTLPILSTCAPLSLSRRFCLAVSLSTLFHFLQAGHDLSLRARSRGAHALVSVRGWAARARRGAHRLPRGRGEALRT